MTAYKKFFVTTALVAVFLASSLVATGQLFGSVVVGAGDYTGSRATVGITGSGGGLVWNPEAGGWSAGNFSLSWNITHVGTDFNYTYTVNAPVNAGTGSQLSHFILELSKTTDNGTSLQSYWESIFVGDPQPFTSTGLELTEGAGAITDWTDATGNPGMPAAGMYGVKFTRNADVETTAVMFTTTQQPVWGDFYAKDGGGKLPKTIYAYNAGFGTDPTGSDFTNWIARPDGNDGLVGGPTVPEPASMIAWSLLGLIGLAFGYRRRSAA